MLDVRAFTLALFGLALVVGLVLAWAHSQRRAWQCEADMRAYRDVRYGCVAQCARVAGEEPHP